MLGILTVSCTLEQDVVLARRRARQIAVLLNFDSQDATRIATAVSEIVRNSQMYASGCRIEFLLDSSAAPAMVIRVTDKGPGIENVDAILSGKTVSASPATSGITAAKRLMDSLEISSKPGVGTVITLRKALPKGVGVPGAEVLSTIGARLAADSENVFEEVRQQNQELVEALEELQARRLELEHLNRELNETNRGVVALSAELEERAETLRRANELKSRFLSYASHEFRTPLNAIAALSRLLLSREERDDEEIKQLTYIQRSAEDLRSIVDDLLDLAKAEAGKLTVHKVAFETTNLLASLRGMFRPLQTSEAVALIFESDAMPELHTDEGKVSQILRNFVSNALKFTEHGEIRVTARYAPETDLVEFSVIDTGCGIAPQNVKFIFDEFTQIDTPLARKHTGTGLGLPLCKRLAELLGGRIDVRSELGAGSTFSVTLPREYGARTGEPASNGSNVVLLVDDLEVDRYLVRNLLPKDWHVLETSTGQEALVVAANLQPDLIMLDLNMPGMSGFEVLGHLADGPATSRIPVIIVTARKLEQAEREALSRKSAGVLFKDELARADKLEIRLGPPMEVMVR